MSKTPSPFAGTFRVKPLEWEYVVGKDDDYENWSCLTVFGTLQVKRNRYSGRWAPWRFDWCVTEYYDEDHEYVDSAEDGKARAEAWYMERLSPALEREKPNA